MKFSLFRYRTGILYGMLLAFDSISPDSGPSNGGVDFVIRGDSFQFPSFDDTFLGALLDVAKWNDISAGSGSVTTGSSHLQLTSGITLGSVAGIEMLSTFTNIQYESKVNIPPVTVNPTATVTLYQMQNFIDVNNQANIIVELEDDGTVTLRCQVYLGGSLTDDYTTEWTTGISTFKILRWNTDIYFYANGFLIHSSKQGNLLAGTFRFFVDNRTTTYNVLNTVVEYVINRPYISFGDQVVHDLTVVSTNRARGLTPPSINDRNQAGSYEGLVDVSVVSNITQTQVDFYEYYYVDSLTLLNETQFDFKFSQIDDETVRTPTLSARGLGGGK